MDGEHRLGAEEFVQLKVIDEEQEQGQLTVFLPSTSEAVVWLRSTETGIKLVTEPTQSSTSSTTTTVEGNGGTAVSSDRLAHVLWVVLTLFAIAFAYVRTVIAAALVDRSSTSAWSDEGLLSESKG